MADEDRLTIRLLGAVAILRGGEPLDVGKPRQRAVLAALALRAGRAVHRDDLIRAVWGEDPPKSAVGNLHTYISGLRKLLPEPSVLHAERGLYRLWVQPRDVDALEFEQVGNRATEAFSDGDVAACLAATDDAAKLWRGTPLGGVEGPLVEAHRRRLEDRWLALRLVRVRALLAVSRTTEAVAECAGLASAFPLDEQVAMVLSEGLARSGRTAEALDKLAATRDRIREELGVAPSSKLMRLYQQLLTGEQDIAGERDGADAGDAPASRTVAQETIRPAQLPHRPWGFVGRKPELAELSGVRDRPIVVSGYAGVGKSALALTLAHFMAPDFPDGQLYMALGGSTPDGAIPVADALDHQLHALGVHADDAPHTVEGKAARLRSLLASRRILLVLDDAANEQQVAALLPEPGSSAAIVTSRRMLSRLPSVHRLALGELDPASAAELLVDGCGTPLDIDPADPWVCTLVARCGHVPLAVRVVAAELADAGTGVAGIRKLAADLREPGSRLGRLSLEGYPQVSIELGLHHAWNALSTDAALVLDRVCKLGDEYVGAGAVADALPEVRVTAALDELVEVCLLNRRDQGWYRLPVLVRCYATSLDRSAA